MAESTTEPTMNVSKEAVRGTLWAYLSFFSGKILAFVSTIILTSILGPEKYGIVGYCLIAIQYLDVVNNFGMNTALISRRDKVKEAANAAFYISIGVGWLLFAIAWISAPGVARFFNEPAVTDLFRVLAITLPLGALGMVPSAMIQRGLRFKAKLIPDLLSVLVKGVAAIALAWLGFGVWSLVWAQLAGVLTSVVILWIMTGWRPSLDFDRQVSREMTVFGSHIVMVGLVGALQDNVDYLLVGRMLGATALGYYTLAYRIPELIIRNFNYVVSRVAHPLLSQLQSETPQLRAIYFGYIRYISLLTFPAGVGLALISPLFFRTFFKPEWEPAIPLMQLIALALALGSVAFVPGVLYKAISRPEILNYMAIVRLPVTIGALWISASWWGITGVAATQLVLAAFNVVLESVVVSRIVKFDLHEMFRSLAPSLASSAVMGLALWLLVLVLPASGIASLLVLILLGIVSYGGMLMLVAPDIMAQIKTTLGSTFNRSKRRNGRADRALTGSMPVTDQPVQKS